MITKCVCFNKTFEEIQRLSREESINSLDSLLSEKNICNKCRICNQYIEEMYKTGQVEYPIDYFKTDDKKDL